MKRITKKKKKKKTVTQLKKLLWKYVSLYVRNRDGFICYCCGKYATGGGMHAGHFVPASICNLEMRYDAEWLRAQCYNCNINKSGNTVTFREKLVHDLGEEAVAEFEQRRHTTVTDFNYEEKIEEYKEKCKALGVV